MGRCRNCKAYFSLIYVAPLLFLAICLLLGTLGLGVYGIIVADNLNPCSMTNGTSNCVAQMTLSPSLGNFSTSESIITTDDPNPDEFLYWLAGATLCGFICALITTFALWALEDMVRRIKKPTPEPSNDMELEDRGSTPLDRSQSPTSKQKKEKIDVINGRPIYKQGEIVLRRLTYGSIPLFLGCLCAILALLSLLWGVAIGINHSRRQERTIVSFVIVEVLVGVALPIFLFVAVIFMGILFQYITKGVLDSRKAITRFLSSVKFKNGEKYDYWIIENSFYFPLAKTDPEASKKKGVKGFCTTCHPNAATWILVTIVFLSLNLAISYFADVALDKQVSVTSCDDSRIDRSFSCFNSSTLVYVDCVNDTEVDFIHCFKFYRFGVDVDLIQSLATSYAFYLVTSAVFGHIFLVLKVLVHVTHRHIWGILSVIVGFVMFLVSAGIALFWFSGYVSPVLPELARLNVINLSQFVMVSWFVILVGFLMINGESGERGPKEEEGGNRDVNIKEGERKAADVDTETAT